MRREWSSEDVVACWTPVGPDWELVANKSGPTRLGFVLMLKFFELEGRFPQFVEEFPQAAVDYAADVVKVSAPGTLYNHIPDLRELRAGTVPHQLEATER
ncbi:DUF4158 domain-containing protein [Streptomyces sp. DSM 41524]|uniref:DUF4158 domain-containing protein n=1 Tax=Streptomyces asiaticus subsp. ignotus TaxID=3098222 RepID=A0ABU7QB13_9ACTN|nr:DUF4158 domain-containing protein [Streptomyces sp. DSM 41524]